MGNERNWTLRIAVESLFCTQTFKNNFYLEPIVLSGTWRHGGTFRQNNAWLNSDVLSYEKTKRKVQSCWNSWVLVIFTLILKVVNFTQIWYYTNQILWGPKNTGLVKFIETNACCPFLKNYANDLKNFHCIVSLEQFKRNYFFGLFQTFKMAPKTDDKVEHVAKTFCKTCIFSSYISFCLAFFCHDKCNWVQISFISRRHRLFLSTCNKCF